MTSENRPNIDRGGFGKFDRYDEMPEKYKGSDFVSIYQNMETGRYEVYRGDFNQYVNENWADKNSTMRVVASFGGVGFYFAAAVGSYLKTLTKDKYISLGGIEWEDIVAVAGERF